MNKSVPLVVELRGGRAWKDDIGRLTTTAFSLMDDGTLPSDLVSLRFVNEGPKQAVVGPADLHPDVLSTVASAFRGVLGGRAEVIIAAPQ